MKEKLIEYQEKIEEWSIARGLNDFSLYKKQCNKVMEEVGEFAGNLARGKCVKDDIGDIFVTIVILSKQLGVNFNMHCVKFFLSGCPVSLYSEVGHLMGIVFSYEERLDPKTSIKNSTILIVDMLASYCYKNDLEFIECVEIAWNEIKNRKGKMINGTFVKEEDIVSKS